MEILYLMPFGRDLRAYGEREHGDFVVGNEITDAILALVREKDALPVEK